MSILQNSNKAPQEVQLSNFSSVLEVIKYEDNQNVVVSLQIFVWQARALEDFEIESWMSFIIFK